MHPTVLVAEPRHQVGFQQRLPRIYLRDVLLRLARETDVRKLTPHGWQQHFADEVEAHRLSILERMLEVHRRA